MTFERVPAFDLSAPALDFQLHERTQGAEKMVADGGFPAHEELLGMADLLDGTMVTLDAPMLAMHVTASNPRQLSCAFFSRVVLGVVSHGVVLINRPKHAH